MWSPRLKISLVSVLGGLTLASAAGYFLALGRALLGSDAEWGEFFASNVLWFLYVPFTLGLLYFFARVQLGRHLLEQGALDEAIAWTKPRLQYSFWMRGKREVLIQRVVLAQAYTRRLEFELAGEVLWLEGPLPQQARELLELYVWRAMWALGQEDLVKASKAIEQGRELKKPAVYRAHLLALDAMRALRASDYKETRRLLEESRWLESTWMADWVRALWVSEDSSAHDLGDAVLDARDELLATLERRVPGALPEYLVAISNLLVQRGKEEDAVEMLTRARQLVDEGRTDPRSAWVVSQKQKEQGNE